jgi:hypothetical protein
MVCLTCVSEMGREYYGNREWIWGSCGRYHRMACINLLEGWEVVLKSIVV